MPRKRGLGSSKVSKARRRDIAQKGNAALRAQNKEHRFTPEEARDAGRKGGVARAHPEDKILAGLRVPPHANYEKEN